MITLPPSIRDRLLTAIRKIILQECPSLTYAGLWEYVVHSVNDDGSVNGTPTDMAIPLPALNNVPIGALAAGGVSRPSVGSVFLVEFANQHGAKYLLVSAAPVVVTATLDATDSVAVGGVAPVALGSGSPGSPATPAVPGGNPKTATVVGCTSGAGGFVLVETAAPFDFLADDTVSITGVTGTTEANTMAAITLVDATHFLLQGVAFANAYTGGGSVLDITYLPPPARPAQPAVAPMPPSKKVARNGDGITVWLPIGVLNGLLDVGGGTKLTIKNVPMQILNPLPGLIIGGNSRVQA